MTTDNAARYDELLATGALRRGLRAAATVAAVAGVACWGVARLVEPHLRPTDEPDYSRHVQGGR